MTTQEMTKQEMIMNLREKREEKKKAKLKAKHRRCTIAIITLVAMMTVIFGSVSVSYTHLDVYKRQV